MELRGSNPAPMYTNYKREELDFDSPAVGTPCPACGTKFKIGDSVTAVPIGPGSDLDEMRKCVNGDAYNAVCILAHWSCVTGRGTPSGVTTDVEDLDDLPEEGDE